MRVPRSLRDTVNEEMLDRLAAAVDAAESRTSGEVHVHLVRSLLPLEKPRRRAVRMFRRLGMDQTAKRNGVLVFAALKKRCFEIVADEGIDAKVTRQVWADIATLISDRIDRDGLAEGLSAGILEIGDVLAEHFPREDDDRNELPNRPTVS